MQPGSFGEEVAARECFRRMIRRLRAGGLKHDRVGKGGQSLDDFPLAAKEFSLAIVGERSYRMTLGLRREDHNGVIGPWLFCNLEHLGPKGEHPWVELQCQVSTDRWRAVTDTKVLKYRMDHPFAQYIFSVDHLAVSPTRFGAIISEHRLDAVTCAAAKLFECSKL